MKLIGFTYKGMEEIAADEAKKLVGVKAKQEVGAIMIDGTGEQLAELTYKTQSLFRVGVYLCRHKVSDIADISKIDIKIFSFLKGKSFKVVVSREGNQEFSSQEVAVTLGGHIAENIKAKVDVHNPEHMIACYAIDDTLWIMDDKSGYDLSHREYKVFPHKESMKGPIAYALVGLSGFNGSQILLDPFCRGGDLIIEAAFSAAGFPLRTYEKDKLQFIEDLILEKLDKKPKNMSGRIIGFDSLLPNIQAASKNAKIGGVNDFIEVSRVDLEWLDVKFKKEEVDLVVTLPLYPAQHSLKKVLKQYDEFFHQVGFIMKKKGTITVLNNKYFEEKALGAGWKKKKTLVITKNNQKTKCCVYVR